MRRTHRSVLPFVASNAPHSSVLFRETTDSANLTAGKTTRLLIHGSLESQRRPDRYEPNKSRKGFYLHRCGVLHPKNAQD